MKRLGPNLLRIYPITITQLPKSPQKIPTPATRLYARPIAGCFGIALARHRYLYSTLYGTVLLLLPARGPATRCRLAWGPTLAAGRDQRRIGPGFPGTKRGSIRPTAYVLYAGPRQIRQTCHWESQRNPFFFTTLLGTIHFARCIAR